MSLSTCEHCEGHIPIGPDASNCCEICGAGVFDLAGSSSAVPPLRGQAMEKMLIINKCPDHGIYSISLENERGGLRLTPSKCCGTWQIVESWRMNAGELRAIINELECAAEELEREDA